MQSYVQLILNVTLKIQLEDLIELMHTTKYWGIYANVNAQLVFLII